MHCLFWALLVLNLALANSQAVTGSNQDRCLLPKLEGLCRASLFRFYFNDATKKCETFLFGGCRGNLNNFGSLQECHEACQHRMAEPVIEGHVRTAHCLGPAVPEDQVECRAFFPRFFYNKDTHECQEFIYGGCGATANVYTSLEQCRSTCYFGNTLNEGNPSRSMIGMRTRFTAPRVVSDAVVIQEDEEGDICKLPPVTPHLRACLAFMQKWTYDFRYLKSAHFARFLISSFFKGDFIISFIFFRQGKCIQYIYGGCHGTANLFDSQAECESTCPGQSEAPVPTLSSMWIQPPFCQEPPMRGMRSCMAMMPKFTFNSEQGT